MRAITSGQVKLGITVQGNRLNIHVHEAFGLRSQWQTKCNAYVQTEICESDSVNSLQRTPVAEEMNCPVFNSQLTHYLRPEDEKKRLLISVWHSDEQKHCSEFLGCLSFGLRHLVAKCTRTLGSNQSTEENTTAPRGVHGWYYLLSAEVGHRKHLLARGNSVTSQGSCDDLVMDSGCCNKENMAARPQDFENMTLTLSHRGSGYGFSVRGPHPIRVGRIKEGGPAQEAGLRKGDVIIKINGEPIRDDDVQHVVNVIRTSAHIVVIEVRRPRVTKVASRLAVEKHVSLTPTRSAVNQLDTQKVHEDFSGRLQEVNTYRAASKRSPRDSCSGEPLAKRKMIEDSFNIKSCGSLQCDNNQNSFKEGLFCKPCGKHMLPQKSPLQTSLNSSTNQKACNICSGEACEHVTCIANQLEESLTSSKRQTLKWNPDMSEILKEHSGGKLVDSFDQHLFGLSYLASYKDLSALAREQFSCSVLDLGHESSAFSSRQNITTHSHQTTFSDAPMSCTQLSDVTSDDSVTSVVDETRSGLCDTQTTIECSRASEQALQCELCVSTLLRCEQSYVQQMQRGIQAFSRPLRACISAQEKEVLFQNLEKLVALSRFNLTQIDREISAALHEQTVVNSSSAPAQTKERTGSCVDQVAEVYKKTCAMLADGYMDYIRGLGDAVKLLRELFTQEEFTQLIQVQKKTAGIDLLEFLQQPVLHFDLLHRTFGELLSLAEEDCNACDELREITEHFQDAYMSLVDF